MLIGKIDAKKLNFNHKLGGIILMITFIIIGFSVIGLQINENVANIKESIFTNNEIVSNDINMQLNLLESFIENKSKAIRFFAGNINKLPSQQKMTIINKDNSWIATVTDFDEYQYYIFGKNQFNRANDALLSEINMITYFVRQYDQNKDFYNNANFIYISNTNQFDVLYPGMTENQGGITTPEEYQLLINKFKSIDFKIPRHSIIMDDVLFMWDQIFDIKYNYATGIAISDTEKLISYPDSTLSEGIYLYSNNKSLTLREEKYAYELPIEAFSNVDENLREVIINDQVYYYKRLRGDVLYISRIGLTTIQKQAVLENITFSITILLSMIMIFIIYFYFLKYRRYLELEMESQEQEFKKSLYKSRLGHIMNTISEAFVRADSTYTILEVNQAAADMFGYRISEMLGQVITNFMVKPIDVKVRKNEGLYTCYEVSLVRKDGGKLYGLVNKSTVIKDNPITKEHYIMISDITPLIAAQQKAEEANRSKSQFIANLSHEIRTPMNATVGYVYLLEQTELTDKQKQYLEKMDYASNTLLEIIDEILDFSKIEADRIMVEHIPLNLHNVITNAVSMFENTAFRKELSLEVDIADNVPKNVIGDPYRFRQILINILSNAFKFTSFGYVKIKAEVIALPYDFHENKSAEDFLEKDTVVRVTVEDSGIGIPKERIKILFDPFVQADDSTTRLYGGTGLGLAICKRLVQLIGGTIHVSSEENKGSTFTIEVPFEKTDTIKMEQLSVPDGQQFDKNPTKKILIVEDNPLNQELLVELLIQEGNTVVVANNGKVAEEILTKPHTSLFDLVLMDIQMPIQDGYMTTKFIRNESPYSNIPIIAVTANADKETQNRLAQSGMNDFLLKPINAADLYTKIGLYK